MNRDQEQTHSRKREKQQNWCSDVMVTMMCVALFAIAGVRPSTPKLHKPNFDIPSSSSSSLF
jgi:hypothetical protein